MPVSDCGVRQDSMPVTYRIDADRKIIRTQCIGPVTLLEVIDHFRQLRQDLSKPDRLDVLLDLTETTSLPAGHQLYQVSQEVGNVRKQLQFGACAIVANRDALFGMMRMFEVIVEEYFDATRVFRSVDEAETWLSGQQAAQAR